MITLKEMEKAISLMGANKVKSLFYEAVNKLPKLEIVINDCYGGFSVSDLAIEKYADITKIDMEELDNYYFSQDKNRADKVLIEVIKEIGLKRASGSCAELKIIEIPEGIDYRIRDYNGCESVEY